jgi:flavin-binding protein dodecin
MSVAKVVELSATSPDSFEEAIRQAIAKASETLRGIQSAWVKEQIARVENGSVTEFQVNLQVTFVLE